MTQLGARRAPHDAGNAHRGAMGNIASACADEPSIEPDSNDLPVAGTRTGGARAEKHRPVSKSTNRVMPPQARPPPRPRRATRPGRLQDRSRATRTPGSRQGARSRPLDRRDSERALEDDFYVSGGAGSIIGEGAFGIVRKVKHARSKRLYAIKSVRVEGEATGV